MNNTTHLKPFLFILLATILSQLIEAQQEYAVAGIPKTLMLNSKAVVRNNEIIFEISDIDKAVMKVKYAVTILNKNGLDNSIFEEFYNKYLSLRKIDWTFYDESGKKIRNNTSVELKDYAAISGYSLYEDDRVKYLDPKYRTTPFTVEYSFEEEFNGLFYYPDWSVYQDFNISVENSKFTIITPKGFKFRYLESNLPELCSITEGDGKTTYTWIAKSQPAIKEEPFGFPLEEFTPVVYTAPDDFEIGGFSGNCVSWSNLSKWIDKLGQDRDKLSPETNEKIKSLIAGLDSDYEKIKVIYSYLQNKVRYVNISKKMGGWQPFDAETVDRLSYGDCKALSNYMKALLRIAGIKSYYTLVLAGADELNLKKNFPSTQFNHAIICVPLPNDTIWLECTSQNIPAGFLGKFTDDRDVLITGEGGGTIVRTKRYTINDNVQFRYGEVDIASDGNAKSKIITDYKGLCYDDVYGVLMMDEMDRKKFILARLNIPSKEIVSIKHTEDRKIIPSIREEVSLNLPNYGTLLNNKIIINPNLMSRFGKLPYKTKDRKSRIRINRSYCEKDSLIINISTDLKVDKLPEKLIFKTKFGEYFSEITCKNDVICFQRSFKFIKGNYQISDYDDFVDFCEKVYNYDERKIALIRQI